DTTVFRPSLVERLDELRGQVSEAMLTLTGLPKGASVLIDGAPAAGPRVKLATGRHRLHLAGDGYRAVDRVVDVSGDLTVPAALPIALDAANRALLARALDERA